MPLPDEDVALVRDWVGALNADMPPHVAGQLRYRMDIYRNALTIWECRARDLNDLQGEWFEVAVARLHFFRSRGWELYWADRDSDFHVYELIEPCQDVTVDRRRRQQTRFRRIQVRGTGEFNISENRTVLSDELDRVTRPLRAGTLSQFSDRVGAASPELRGTCPPPTRSCLWCGCMGTNLVPSS